MKIFKNEEAAKAYAATLGKNDYEIVSVNGQPTFVCSTCLPQEEFFRNQFESSIRFFLRICGLEDNEDGILEMGAELESLFLSKSKEILGVDFVSPYLDF